MSTYPIDAVNNEQNRRDFGNWLSGFADGEGCFFLRVVPQRKNTTKKTTEFQYTFRIALRQDDAPILEEIRVYLRCGKVSYLQERGKTKPTVAYEVWRIKDLVGKIIRHFDQHPLRAKKARDYEIWREAVLIVYRVSRRIRGGPKGKVRWTEPEVQKMRDLVNELKLVRLYSGYGTTKNTQKTTRRNRREINDEEGFFSTF